MFWHVTVVKQKLCLYETELFEIELFICIKIDLALVTYNGWYVIKQNQTKISVSHGAW